MDWLAGEGLTLPKRVQAMDAIVSDYLEFLWATGESKSTANNTLAALQDKNQVSSAALLVVGGCSRHGPQQRCLDVRRQ